METLGLLERSIDSSFRRELAEVDWIFFCKYYLPEHFSKPFADMHLELLDDFSTLLQRSDARQEQSHEVVAFPREFGKTTIVSLALVLYCVLFQKRRFIIALAQGYDQAKDYLGDVRTELEVNERIIDDFGDLRGIPWQASEIRTSTGIRVKPLGSRMKLRGRKERFQRPDLVVADDLEDIVSAKNEAERTAKKRWVERTVLKAGTDNTVFFFVGNLIHEDGVIAMLLENPLFIKREYKAVTSWAERDDLWTEWRRILTSYPADAERGKAEARHFFHANHEEMMKNAISSWPTGKSYYDLMVMLVVGGRISFFAEMQNEPVSDEDRIFNFEQYRTIASPSGDVILVPLNGGPAAKLKECVFFMAVDPSLGKRGGDPSAIVILARSLNGQLFIMAADIQVRAPYKIIQDLLNHFRQFPAQRCGIEAVQFQALFATDAAREAMKAGVYVPFVQLTPVTNKRLRIQSLEPAVSAAYILMPEFGAETLKHQAAHWPNVAHEDGLDALELCYQLVQDYTADELPQIIEGESVIAGDGTIFAPQMPDIFYMERESLAIEREAALAIEAGEEPPEEMWIPILRY